MRDTETVLNIIQDRGGKNLPLDEIYRQLYNPNLYLQAYSKIYANSGAMTKGIDNETVDEMSLLKIRAIIDGIRKEKHQWSPVRRIEIPKTNGKTRPLGIPTWSDKLLQEVMRCLVEAYYEPQFSRYSHGFKPHKGCHTALLQIKQEWQGVKWFIEGDIKGCFNNIAHDILITILKEKIIDNRFIRLIDNLLKAGYMEDWKYMATLSGTPQGGIFSPLLANIYLDKLDKFVEGHLIPKFTKGHKRAHTQEYDSISNQIYKYRRLGLVENAKELEQKRRLIPSSDPYDPEYRRLKYVRYADDILLGFSGTRIEAEQIKQEIQDYLWNELKLELSMEKTLITHASTEKAKFLGYAISVTQCNSKITTNRRCVNGNIRLAIPSDFINSRAKFYMKSNKPIHRKERMEQSDYAIVNQYQAEYRGYVQYYQLAENLIKLHKLHWIMQTSLLKTLAHKHKASVKKIYAKLKATVKTKHGPRRCLEVRVIRPKANPLTARFGGIPLATSKIGITINDRQIDKYYINGHSELLVRLLQQRCEQCSSSDNIEVHHVRKLSDINTPGRKEKPDWIKLMSSMRRKTLVLCRSCHRNLHAGRPMNKRPEINNWRAV